MWRTHWVGARAGKATCENAHSSFCPANSSSSPDDFKNRHQQFTEKPQADTQAHAQVQDRQKVALSGGKGREGRERFAGKAAVRLLPHS
eukprot:361885-Chlamydomonas_euryale.AAC.5